MPRITLARVLSILPSLYLLAIVLWLALPFPPNVSDSVDNRYHQRVLRSGQELTTIHWAHRWINSNPDGSTSRNAFALKWQLKSFSVADRKHVSLFIGGQSVANLTEVASVQVPYTSKSIDGIVGLAGDQDGANPPYFPFADATLLYWDIHHDITLVDLIVTVLEPGTFQVWPAQTEWNAETKRRNLEPFMTLTGLPTAESSNPLDISKITVTDMSADVPSKTYWLRRRIIWVIAPLTMIVYHTFEIFAEVTHIATIVHAMVIVIFVAHVYCLAIAVCWMLSGFPKFDEWKKTFLLTRIFVARDNQERRVVWGLSGPIVGSDNVTEPGSGPRPLTGVMSFFKSKSPLDDLLVTFESTKWMTRSPAPRIRERFASDDIESSSSNSNTSNGLKIKIDKNAFMGS